MKRYVNGYDAPTFEIIRPNGTKELITLALTYQALTEYEEDVATTDVFTDGSKEQIIHYYNMEWRLTYVSEITLDERMKLLRVQEAFKSGYRVVLTPHKDFPWRHFDVVMVPEKRELDQDEFFSGLDDSANYGFSISFANSRPITKLDIADPNQIPVSSARVYFEF